MRLFYLNCIRRTLLLLCLLLTVTIVYLVLGSAKPGEAVDVEIFELPEILTAKDDSQAKAFIKPLDTYKAIWTRPLRANLNPPKIEAPKTPPKPPEPKLPALAGIIFEPVNSFALFTAEGGKILLKRESEKINDFTISRILLSAVELSFKQKTYELKLPKKEVK